MRPIILALLAASLGFAQQDPDVAGQREAMKKLEFLVGTWTGEATVTTGPRGPIHVLQTENVEMKLDGLVLLIEGTARDPVTKDVVFRALATISYAPAARVYRFRAFNDGRVLDTEMKVNDKGFEWGYKSGPAVIGYVMRLNEKGEWVETGEMKMGEQPPAAADGYDGAALKTIACGPAGEPQAN